MHLYVSVEYVYNGAIAPFQIVGQIPVTGTQAHQGDVVTLSVNQGEKMVTVVDVREKALESAITELEGLGLDVYTVSKESDIYKAGTVFEQSIAARYSDGSTKDVTNQCTFSAEKFSSKGTQTVTVKYKEGEILKSATFRVTVDEKQIEFASDSVTLKKGTTESLSVANVPRNATWSTSDASVATVNGGKVTGVNVGQAIIKVSTGTGMNAMSASCVVHVVSSDIGVENITLNKSSIEINEYSTFTLTATLIPYNATDTTVSWSSSNKDVANVNAGTVTAVSAGTATITAKTSNGLTATCTVKVKQLKVKSITPVGTYKTEYYPGEQIDLTGLKLDVLYEGGLQKTVTSESEYTYKIVDKGEWNKVVVISYKGATANINISYNEAGVVVSSATGVKSVYTGGSLKLVAQTNPAGYNITSWSSNNESVATVDSNGIVTGKKAGTAVITAKFKYGSGNITISVKEATLTGIEIKTKPSKTTGYYIGDKIDSSGLVLKINYEGIPSAETSTGYTISPAEITSETGSQTVTVKWGSKTASYTISGIKIPALSLSKEKLDMKDGEKVKLTAKTEPTGQKVEWSSEGYVSVDRLGNVTASGSGKGKVIARMVYNGRTYEANCDVSVTGIEVTSISLEGNYKTSGYYPGDEIDTSGMSVRVNYNDGTHKNVSSGFTVSPRTAGSSPITVSYGGKSAVYNISLSKPSIKIKIDGSSMDCLVNLTENHTASYELTPSSGNWTDGEWVISGNSVQVNGSNIYASKPGRSEIRYKAKYNGTDYESSAIAIEVKELKIIGYKLDNLEYLQSIKYEDLVASDIRIQVVYENGDTGAESYNKNSTIEKAENTEGGYFVDISYDGEYVDTLYYDEDGVYTDHANNS